MTYQKVHYGGSNYYLDPESTFVYDKQFQSISDRRARQLKFQSVLELHNLLCRLVQKPRSDSYNREQFKQILAENFLIDSYELSAGYLDGLLAGVNYATIKRSDHHKMLDTMDLIIGRNKGLVYKYLSLDLGRKIDNPTLRKHPYFRLPYGRMENGVVYGIPYVFSKQMDLLKDKL